MAREFAKPFYNSEEWKSIRVYILIRDKYKCTKCGDSGQLEVHHKIHLTPENINDSSITLNAENLTTLCRNCHFSEHETQRNGSHKAQKKKDCDEDFKFDENGNLIRANIVKKATV